MNEPTAPKITTPIRAYQSIRFVIACSIRPREHHPALRRLARQHVLARLLRPAERDAADRRLRLLLDAVLRRPRAVPVRPHEPRLLDQPLELVVAVGRADVRLAERQRLGVQAR